ncbi:MAG: hypothetical protein M1836_001637 [Candelina mexicana]|nr:MAG: hypothetical protein M1836_001637 [Candelina mexicana]
MEPISVLGAAASAITVVQLCTDSLEALFQLRDKYKNADLTVRLLITQLSTLRTALSQISEWVNDSVHDATSELVLDLTTSLDGCRFLMETLNDRLKCLESDDAKPLTMRKRTLMIWREKERTDFLALLGHNIAALQLLLTAMSCRSQSRQAMILQKSNSQEIIRKARDGTSSLLWLRDDESQGTRKSVCTENSDLLESSFAFDREVFSSRAYLTAMKSSMKRSVREARSKAQAKQSSHDAFEEPFQSQEDVQTLTKATRGIHELTEEFQVSKWLASAAPESHSHGGSSSDLSVRIPNGFAPDFWDLNAFEATESTSSHQEPVAWEEATHNPKETSQGSRRLLRMPSLLKSRSALSSQPSLDVELESPESVSCDEEKLLLIGNAKVSGSTILRSIELAYGRLNETTPTQAHGIKETLIAKKSAGVRCRYRIYDAIGLHSKDNKWIYSFDEMSTLIYVVDVSAYSPTALDHMPSSRVEEDLSLFQQICSSKWLAITPILLLLSNTDILKSKLQDYPLADYLPDYTGGPTDLEAAKSFLRQKFLSLNHKYSMRIWVVFTDSVATVKLGKVIVSNVDKILMEEAVLTFGAR